MTDYDALLGDLRALLRRLAALPAAFVASLALFSPQFHHLKEAGGGGGGGGGGDGGDGEEKFAVCIDVDQLSQLLAALDAPRLQRLLAAAAAPPSPSSLQQAAADAGVRASEGAVQQLLLLLEIHEFCQWLEAALPLLGTLHALQINVAPSLDLSTMQRHFELLYSQLADFFQKLGQEELTMITHAVLKEDASCRRSKLRKTVKFKPAFDYLYEPLLILLQSHFYKPSQPTTAAPKNASNTSNASKQQKHKKRRKARGDEPVHSVEEEETEDEEAEAMKKRLDRAIEKAAACNVKIWRLFRQHFNKNACFQMAVLRSEANTVTHNVCVALLGKSYMFFDGKVSSSGSSSNSINSNNNNNNNNNNASSAAAVSGNLSDIVELNLSSTGGTTGATAAAAAAATTTAAAAAAAAAPSVDAEMSAAVAAAAAATHRSSSSRNASARHDEETDPADDAAAAADTQALSLVTHPNDMCVARRNVKAAPALRIGSTVEASRNLVVTCTLIQQKGLSEKEINSQIVGNEPRAAIPGAIVEFPKLKIQTTSHKSGDAKFILKFRLVRRGGGGSGSGKDEVLDTVTTYPLTIVSHNSQLKNGDHEATAAVVPHLTDVVPSSGPPGTRVAILGRDFCDTAALSVMFGDSQISAEVYSQGTLLCHAPELSNNNSNNNNNNNNATQEVKITVSNNRKDYSKNDLTFQYTGAPPQ